VLFYLVKLPVIIALLTYFRWITWSNRDRIPKGRRIIFAINHPSAILDFLVAAAFLPYSVYILARGDVYVNPLVRSILASLHMLPIFRFRDGFNRMRGNQDTFDRCYRILEKGKSPVMLAAEGGNSERKRLLPLQKGAAKLAFGAYEEKGFRDIALVPIGVNYSDVQRFRGAAMVSVGEPLLLENYLETHAQDPRQAVQDLTADLERSLRNEVVAIDRAEDETWANPLLDILREKPRRPFSTSRVFLEREFARVARINAMSPEERQACAEAVERHRARPKALKKSPWWGFLYALGVLPFGAAWLLNAPPLYFSHWLIRRLVPSPIFFPSIRFVTGLFVYAIYAIAIGVLGSLGIGELGIGNWGIGVLAGLGIGAMGWLSLGFFERFRTHPPAPSLPREGELFGLDIPGKTNL